MATRTIDAQALTNQVTEIFKRLGMSEADARVVAEHLVEADLRGVHSHGVIRVPAYVEQMKSGRVNPRPNIRIVTDNGAQVVMDGDNAMGQLAAFRANEVAIERGKKHGMAGVALRGSNHAGAMAYYPLRAIAHGLIGWATTNAGINMPPTGGTMKLVGNNPYAMALPSKHFPL